MPYINYKYDPNDPQKTAYERDKAYGQYFSSIFMTGGSIGCLIYYIFSVISLFHGKYSYNLIISVFSVVIIAFFDYYIIFGKMKNNKKTIKKFVLFFVGGLLNLTGIIAIIVSIFSLYHREGGLLLLILAICCVVIVSLLLIILYRKIEKLKPIKLYSSNRDSIQKLLGDQTLELQICEDSIQKENE